MRSETGAYDGVKISSRVYNSALINGRGRFRNNRAPLSTFTVPTGGSVNFRIIHVGPDYPFRFSVDQHELTVTASDGYDMAPRSVQSAILYPGESYNIRINGSADPDLYWIRAKTLRVGHCTKCYPYNEANVVPDDAIEEVRAVLRYQGVLANSDPNTSKRNCSAEYPCYVFNCPFAGYPEHLNTFCININKAEAPVSSLEGEKSKVTDNDDEHSLITEASDVTGIFLNFNFAIGSSVNGRRFIGPTAPLYQDSAAVIVPCAKEQCLRSGCRCTHIIDIPYNKTIQLVMYNTFAPASQTHHSVHIHGHAFHVLAMGYPSYNKTTGRYVQPNTDVKCKNELCTDATWRDEPLLLNLMNPPLKDTVLVPANGYTVVRFRSDNPGHWFLHCHNDQHMNEGMALVLQEAADRHPSPPRGFPRCGDFTWSSEEYQRALEDNGSLDIQTTALDTKVLILSTVVGVLAIVIILAVAGYCILKMKKKDASSLTVVAESVPLK
ncbi:PREDICTED: laccase-1-like [Branchiostoma belcheri]|uniref:ferroxidase n=1 Tax=Branchiostoma belcheri TaxID=7741 RepID=A0A6P4YDG0_BRABE|nr:PREDICTED: laccase-1-like [Branchiostoma belcheri]